MASTANRTAVTELQRQIAFQEVMKDRALTKYLAKVAEIDGKIETLNELKAQAETEAKAA